MIVLLESDWHDAPKELRDLLETKMSFGGTYPDYVFLGDFVGDLEGLCAEFESQVNPKKCIVDTIKFLPTNLHYLFEGKNVFSKNMFTVLVAWY